MDKTKADTLPESWIKTTLGNISILRGQYGLGASSVDFQTGKPRYIRITDIDNNGELNNEIKSPAGNAEEWKDYFLDEGDLLFARSGATVGKTYLHKKSDEAFVFAGYLIRFKINQEIADPLFIFYFSKTSFYSNWVSSIQTVAAQPNVNASSYGSLKIPLPPLAEQKQIVAILQEADALRRKKKDILEKSNRLASALFLEMFGDHNQKKEEVKTVKLKDITLRITDGVHQKPDYTQEGVPFISVKDITTRKLIFDDCKYISFSDYEKFTKRTKPERGDILYTKVGATYGRAALIDTDKEFSIYVSVCLIKPNHSLVDSVFLKNILNLPIIKKQADARIRGIGVPDLHLDQIQEFKFPLPPRHLQNDFAKKVEANEETTKQIESSLLKMEKLYDSLLQKAFSGDLTESWRKRNPDVKDNNVKSKKIQLQAFSNDLEEDTKTNQEVTKKSSISPLHNAHRIWIKQQLSEEQEVVLLKLWQWEGFIHSQNIDSFIGDVLYKNEFWSGEEGKARIFRILNQLTGIGLVEKATLQTNEFNFVTVYRLLEENDRNRTQESDIEKIRYPL